MKPQETRNGEILNDFSLMLLPSSPHSPQRVLYYSNVAVGSDIYAIGGCLELSSSVRILDCQSHTWRDGPNMMIARSDPVAVYLDEKIYVMGGCKNDESANWFEVFDIKTQTWKALPNPDHELREYFYVNPDALEKKLYLAADTKDYTYEPKDGTWKVVREVSSCQQILYSCVIENVMYSFCDSHGHIKWYDTEGREWREVKGLDIFYSHRWGLICIVNYGGKLVVMWRQWSAVNHSQNPETKICCAKIALEKRHGDEIWGTLEWCNIVLTLPNSYYCLTTCVAVSI
ncbi:Kelch repeat type 1 [Arabidopsis thaliana x Arabidopsis arenosa]|uniref:Kelch repeat type 1 n=1 Tax=Arabidopsis thaliana x Arabidopsis arenosa TaxID=1240361 RepID=A0A8T1Y9C2_9BRAS|nr:Kelch repeat type 1 [Arabidopsis thaliana x Arabidopsis arenosa]